VRRLLIQLIWDRKIDPGKVFDLNLLLEAGVRSLPSDVERGAPRSTTFGHEQEYSAQIDEAWIAR
jgi:hypothetical protein